MKKTTILTISIFCILGLIGSFSFADLLLFNGFESPFSGITGSINTPGSGVSQSLTIDTVAHTGTSALKWTQTAGPSGFGGSYPQWWYNYSTTQNFTGATVLSAWEYWDINTTSGPMFWTIQFWIRDTGARTDLGNWNENGTFSAPSMYHRWYYRQWPSSSGPSNLSGIILNQVTQVGCYSHANDYVSETTANGTITVWIDDVKLEGPTIAQNPQISPTSANLRPGGNQIFTVSGTSGPYTWSLSTSTLGTLSPNTGASVTFTASSSYGTVTVTVTDGNSASATATISVSQASAPLAVNPTLVNYGRKEILRKDYELYE